VTHGEINEFMGAELRSKFRLRLKPKEETAVVPKLKSEVVEVEKKD
jgi:hypothetical protein